MSAALLAEMAFKSLVVAGVALLLVRLCERRSAAERAWVAHAGLIATLLLPALILLTPDWEVIGPLTQPAIPGGTTPISVDPTPFLYAIPAVLLLGALGLALGRLSALRRRAAVLTDRTWLAALRRARARMGFRHGADLLVSSELASPVSWGVLNPVIMLSESAVAAREDAEAIIAHELAHVARLDWAMLIASRVAVALHWFNPLVWLLAAQCDELREEAADDAVLRGDVSGVAYAALLVGEARRNHRSPGLLAHAVAPRRGSLKRRVMRVLDPRRHRGPARPGWSTLNTFGMAALAVPLAVAVPCHCEHETLASARPARMQAAAPTLYVTLAAAPAKPKPARVTKPKQQAIVKRVALARVTVIPKPVVAPALPDEVAPLAPPVALVNVTAPAPVRDVCPQTGRPLNSVSRVEKPATA